MKVSFLEPFGSQNGPAGCPFAFVTMGIPLCNSGMGIPLEYHRFCGLFPTKAPGAHEYVLTARRAVCPGVSPSSEGGAPRHQGPELLGIGGLAGGALQALADSLGRSFFSFLRLSGWGVRVWRSAQGKHAMCQTKSVAGRLHLRQPCAELARLGN